MRNICTVPNCGRFVKARGVCDAHYRRLLAHGDACAADPIHVAQRGCAAPGCTRPGKTTRGLCWYHQRRVRAGKPLDGGRTYKPRRGAKAATYQILCHRGSRQQDVDSGATPPRRSLRNAITIPRL